MKIFRVAVVSLVLVVPGFSAFAQAVGNSGLTMNVEGGIGEDRRIIGWANFLVTPDNAKFYRLQDDPFIRLKNTEYCVGVNHIAKGLQFLLKKCDANAEGQKFTFKQVTEFPGSDVQIVRMGGYCMDLKAAANGDPALVILWDCHERGNQQWTFVP